ncbi:MULTISPECIES: hypothetical protein [unclassified Sphingomonas]|uniref:hypothetical protein n=1 Tax=unclassified Sphingomonas TaxID=196159 RepID=UPI000A5A5339|nr:MULTISPECIES: hypothetical protein [unclassified Sphingomonas]
MLKSWYPSFAQLLMSGVQKSDITSAFENVRFIIFNYDRCFEQYIWSALQDYFLISADEASEVLSKVRFIHPYGSLGPLPWSGGSSAVPLGGGTVEDIAYIVPRIRTFTESVQSDIGGIVKEAMEWATTHVVLGFGYLDQNIQLLSPSGSVRASRTFSTAYGVSIYDQVIMRDAMIALSGVDAEAVMINAGTCRDLFDSYRLHFSLR